MKNVNVKWNVNGRNESANEDRERKTETGAGIVIVIVIETGKLIRFLAFVCFATDFY